MIKKVGLMFGQSDFFELTIVMGTGTWGMRNNFRFYQKNLEE